MNRELKIRDTTLRDGHQSLFATRMSTKMIEPLLPDYRKAGFYALEVWGGAVPDAAMRYLGEDPWERLDVIKAAIGDGAKLTALSRGRNLFGYEPYPDRVIEPFCREAVKSGIGIMRIFDALNDADNVASTIRFVKDTGAIADCAVCYTTDPPRKWWQTLAGTERRVFTARYFLQRALEMQKLGADMITIKDMAGLVDPKTAFELVGLLKRELDVPVDFHTHCTPGYGTASAIAAIAAGADIVDANLLPFSGGPAGPAVEVLLLAARHMGRTVDCE
ncbi:MAG: carboxylase, partial [Deltaproteobacteria bacterium]